MLYRVRTLLFFVITFQKNNNNNNRYAQHDTEGAAAFAFRTIGTLDGVTDVLSWWTFSDIFEEHTAVEKHTEYMNIYGLMTVSGVPKPSWREEEHKADAAPGS